MRSQTAEYALRAVVFLGRREGGWCTTAQLAARIDAPPEHLAKVVKGLARVGIVAAQRGPYGGVRLARDPGDLSILDVVCAVDAFHRIPRCPVGWLAHNSGLCPLHRPLDNIMAATAASGDRATIGELLDEPGLPCASPCVTEPLLNMERETVV